MILARTLNSGWRLISRPARPSRSSARRSSGWFGCFAYSPVDGAAANALPGQLALEVREARRARFMEAQAAISARRLRNRVGTRCTVLVDAIEHDPGAAGWRAAARSAGEAPEIDGLVYVALDGEAQARALPPGSELAVHIVDADEHDLFAVPV